MSGKPHIRPAPYLPGMQRFYWCSGEGVSMFGSTPQEAYTRWRQKLWEELHGSFFEMKKPPFGPIWDDVKVGLQ